MLHGNAKLQNTHTLPKHSRDDHKPKFIHSFKFPLIIEYQAFFVSTHKFSLQNTTHPYYQYFISHSSVHRYTRCQQHDDVVDTKFVFFRYLCRLVRVDIKMKGSKTQHTGTMS